LRVDAGWAAGIALARIGCSPLDADEGCPVRATLREGSEQCGAAQNGARPCSGSEHRRNLRL
jgi:hypothetical protein